MNQINNLSHYKFKSAFLFGELQMESHAFLFSLVQGMLNIRIHLKF